MLDASGPQPSLLPESAAKRVTLAQNPEFQSAHLSTGSTNSQQSQRSVPSLENTEIPFTRPSHDAVLATAGPGRQLLYPPAPPEVVSMHEPQSKTAKVNGGCPTPSCGTMMSGLLQQKELVRSLQFQLGELHRTVDKTLKDAEQAMADVFGNTNARSLVAPHRRGKPPALKPALLESSVDMGQLGSIPIMEASSTGKTNDTMLFGSPWHSTAMPSLNSVAPPVGFARRVTPQDSNASGSVSISDNSDRVGSLPLPESERQIVYMSETPKVMFASQAPTIGGLQHGVNSYKSLVGLGSPSRHALHSSTSGHISSQGGQTESISRMVGDIEMKSTSHATAEKLAARLQSRLSIRSVNTLVTGQRLHKTLKHLGSHKYTVEDLNHMVQAIAKHCDSTVTTRGDEVGVPFTDFVKFFLELDQEMSHGGRLHRMHFDQSTLDMTLACREILVAGDANRLVAELTQVNVDEIAQRAHVDTLGAYLEPAMSIVIFLNSIAIGVSASDEITGDQSPDGLWFWVDCAFTAVFLFEFFIRVLIRGAPWNAHGHEFYWNIFDAMLVVLGVVDIILTLMWEANHATGIFGVIRLVRLARLSRLFRVFRAKHLRELLLMVKGLLAGLRTLLWAIFLLLFTVYILGIFATKTLGGRAPEATQEDLFRSVPLAMFTVFRCLMGDCEDQEGRPIVYMYYQEHGFFFVVIYVLSMVMVVFGLFNLIFAIYIETTLAAAKQQHKMDRKESVRIARHTRELLKKFALAQTLLENQDPDKRETYGDTKEFALSMQRSSHAAEINEGRFQVSRELFELVLKDQEVQTLLDALDISPDRTHLFDILDADCSGAIEPAELIQGLLQVRGEAKKSDVVANLLAVRAVQHMLRNLEKEHADFRADMNRLLPTMVQQRTKDSLQG